MPNDNKKVDHLHNISCKLELTRNWLTGGKALLKMVDIEFIKKKHFREGWSIRKLSKTLEISRQAIRKAINSTDVPKYNLRKPKASPVLGQYHELIKKWLQDDETSPHKQRHTARRIFDRLVNEYGYTGAESTVRRYINIVKSKPREVFIPLTADYGEQAQIDWGKAFLTVGGTLTRVNIFCFRLRASGVAFAAAFPTEKIEAFLAGHQMAFEWLGGVPQECVYDNLKTAVVKRLDKHERQEHVLFSALRAHYLFDSKFCNPAKGNEKGSVENLVGYVRRNALVPDIGWDSFEELNSHLKGWCNKERQLRSLKWEQEKNHLQSLPTQSYVCASIRSTIVSSRSLIAFDRNHYSVPCAYVGQAVYIKALWNKVIILSREKIIAEHIRCYDQRQVLTQVEHYLPVLEKKPRAADQAIFVRRLGPVWDKARRLLNATNQTQYELVKILGLFKEFKEETITAAVAKSIEMNQLSFAYVRHLITNSNPPENAAVKVDLPIYLENYRARFPDLTMYDSLAPRGISI